VPPDLNLILQNRTLSFAIALSVLVHAVLLTVRFVSPESFRLPPANPALEVVLVNAKHNRPALNPDALAQADLDGGGHADDGHAKSPLPDMQRVEDGDSLKTSHRRIAELQEQQQKLMSQLRQANHKTPKTPLKAADQPNAANSTDFIDSVAIARREAEIAKNIEDQNKRPHKTFITPSTQRVEYAMYYKTLQRRVEEIGTLNFPQQDGKKLYGELLISIPIFHDGTIYEKDGGPRIERSSGIPALDSAAIRIVRRASPFGRFPPNMRHRNGDDLWVVITLFKFTREQALEAQMQSN
jgi:periplasmic protein TonB